MTNSKGNKRSIKNNHSLVTKPFPDKYFLKKVLPLNVFYTTV